MNYIANIRRVLALATPDEIADGLVAYRMQHGVARVLTSVYGLPSLAHAAGIIASLSPLNNWDDNVTDAFNVAAWSRVPDEIMPKVRTTYSNRDKAVRIALGEHPEHVLTGRKVRTFYALTVAPDAGCLVAVDRHLACAAAGEVMTEHEITKLLAREYDNIEASFIEIARSNSLLGHQVGSVVWYAWRRMKLQSTLGQRLIA